MAFSMPGFAEAVYNATIEGYAKDFAFAFAGSPLFDKDFDRQKHERYYQLFKERINTPEKLIEWGMALDRAERGED